MWDITTDYQKQTNSGRLAQKQIHSKGRSEEIIRNELNSFKHNLGKTYLYFLCRRVT